MKVVIMAGGRGTRFWPLGRHHLPKQFTPTPLGTLAERAYALARLIVSEDDVYIHTQPDLVRIAQAHFPSERIIAFPTAGTAEVVYGLLAHADPDEPVLFLPSDHYIHPLDEFARVLREAAGYAGKALILIGILPHASVERFGYVLPEEGVQWPRRVRHFKEKPPRNEAEQLILQGALWNAGVFILTPRIARSLTKDEVLLHLIEGNGGSGIREDSFDKAVIEHADSVLVMPFKGVWNDVGTWQGLLDALRLGFEDVTLGRGEALRSEASLVFLTRRDGILLGLPRHVLVETPDAVLLAHEASAEATAKAVPDMARKAESWDQHETGGMAHVLSMEPRILLHEVHGMLRLPPGRLLLIRGRVNLHANEAVIRLTPGESITRDDPFFVEGDGALLVHTPHHEGHVKRVEDTWFVERASPTRKNRMARIIVMQEETPRLAPAARKDMPAGLLLTPGGDPLIARILSYLDAYILTRPEWYGVLRSVTSHQDFILSSLQEDLPRPLLRLDGDVFTFIPGMLYASSMNLFVRDLSQLEALAREEGLALLAGPLGKNWPVPLVLLKKNRAYAVLDEPSHQLRDEIAREALLFPGVFSIRRDMLHKFSGKRLKDVIREVRPPVVQHSGRLSVLRDWDAYAAVFPPPEDTKHGSLLTRDTVVYAPEDMSMIGGVSGSVLVAVPDMILAADRKDLAVSQHILDTIFQRKSWIVPQAWGWYRILWKDDDFLVRLIRVRSGMDLVLEEDAAHDRSWLILEGSGRIMLSNRSIPFQQGVSFHLPHGVSQRLQTDDPVLILDVRIGSQEAVPPFKENDQIATALRFAQRAPLILHANRHWSPLEDA